MVYLASVCTLPLLATSLLAPGRGSRIWVAFACCVWTIVEGLAFLGARGSLAHGEELLKVECDREGEGEILEGGRHEEGGEGKGRE